MVYREIPPPDALSGIVASYWHFTLEAADPSPVLHTIPPDGAVMIAWIARRQALMVVGPRVEALRLEVHGGTEYTGARILPGAASVLGIDAAAARDCRAPLAQYTPHLAANLLPRLAVTPDGLEANARALSSIFEHCRRGEPDTVVAQLVRRLVSNEDARIEDLIGDLGLGYRQLLRRFRAAVGLTPKEFARLQRIRSACMRAVIEIEGPSGLADISAGAGFADQSHMTREFGRAFGWPPSLVVEYLRQIEHAGVR